MKAEKIMANITAYVKTLDDTEQTQFNEIVEKKLPIQYFRGIGILSNVFTECQEELRAETLKQRGVVKRDKLLKSLFKTISSTQIDKFFECYAKVENLFVFSNGFLMYALNENFGLSESKNPMNFEKFVFDARRASKKVQIDTVALDIYIKTEKAKKTSRANMIFKIEQDGIKYAFNALYLQEFLQMFNIDYLMFLDNNTTMAYHLTENGEAGVLCGVRC